ncbi:MAG: alpha/beta hydrolase-fold protein [Nakamurella sp.]
MPTPEAAKHFDTAAATAPGRHRRPTIDEDDTAPISPVISNETLELRVADPEHDWDAVRFEVDWMLGEIDPEFSWSNGSWSLPMRRPQAWRLEYQLTQCKGGEYHWTTDPGNPRRVANPFGEKSEIRFPDYREPNWILTKPAGPLRWIDTKAGRLEQPVPVQLWSPEGLSADTVAPLLLVHDGTDMADRGSLLSWATALSTTLPIRVALLDPPHGMRDRWYSANPDYSDHLAEVVLPALTSRVLTGPVIGLGASLGALAMLALQRRHPGSISALALQSGSFFCADLDAQENRFAYFEQICAAVRFISAGPDLAAAGTPRRVPVLITCGAIEENKFNNESMAKVLRDQHYPVTMRVVPDAHTMIGWRDAWFPALDELIGALR